MSSHFSRSKSSGLLAGLFPANICRFLSTPSHWSSLASGASVDPLGYILILINEFIQSFEEYVQIVQCPFGCVAGVFLLRHCSTATRAMAHSKAVDSKLSRASPMAPAGFTVGGPCNGHGVAMAPLRAARIC